MNGNGSKKKRHHMKKERRKEGKKEYRLSKIRGNGYGMSENE